MTADPEAHGFTTADITRAIARTDQWHEHLDTPSEPDAIHQTCGWAGNHGNPCHCDGNGGSTT